VVQQHDGLFAGAKFLEKVVLIAVFQERRDEGKVKAGARHEWIKRRDAAQASRVRRWGMKALGGRASSTAAVALVMVEARWRSRAGGVAMMEQAVSVRICMKDVSSAARVSG
jgi:hypothetical protein